jgi:hypothetical protein
VTLEPWQRPIHEATDFDRVDVGDFIALSNGLLVALPADHNCPPTVVYALPEPTQAFPTTEAVIDSPWPGKGLYQGAIRRMGAARNSGRFCPLPVAHLSKLIDGKLIHADSPGEPDPPFLPYHVQFPGVTP